MRQCNTDMTCNPLKRWNLMKFWVFDGTRYRHSFNEILVGTYTRPTQQCYFECAWVTQIVNATKHRAVSLQQLSFLLSRVSILTRGVSILTRDIDSNSVCQSVCPSVCLCVCPSVAFRYSMETA